MNTLMKHYIMNKNTTNIKTEKFSFSILMRRPPKSTLFPYTTLFRPRRRCRRPSEPHRRRARRLPGAVRRSGSRDRKSTRLNSSHPSISYAVFCLKKKKINNKKKKKKIQKNKIKKTKQKQTTKKTKKK